MKQVLQNYIIIIILNQNFVDKVKEKEFKQNSEIERLSNFIGFQIWFEINQTHYFQYNKDNVKKLRTLIKDVFGLNQVESNELIIEMMKKYDIQLNSNQGLEFTEVSSFLQFHIKETHYIEQYSKFVTDDLGIDKDRIEKLLSLSFNKIFYTKNNRKQLFKKYEQNKFPLQHLYSIIQRNLPYSKLYKIKESAIKLTSQIVKYNLNEIKNNQTSIYSTKEKLMTNKNQIRFRESEITSGDNTSISENNSESSDTITEENDFIASEVQQIEYSFIHPKVFHNELAIMLGFYAQIQVEFNGYLLNNEIYWIKFEKFLSNTFKFDMTQSKTILENIFYEQNIQRWSKDKLTVDDLMDALMIKMNKSNFIHSIKYLYKLNDQDKSGIQHQVLFDLLKTSSISSFNDIKYANQWQKNNKQLNETTLVNQFYKDSKDEQIDYKHYKLSILLFNKLLFDYQDEDSDKTLDSNEVYKMIQQSQQNHNEIIRLTTEEKHKQYWNETELFFKCHKKLNHKIRFYEQANNLNLYLNIDELTESFKDIFIEDEIDQDLFLDIFRKIYGNKLSNLQVNMFKIYLKEFTIESFTKMKTAEPIQKNNSNIIKSMNTIRSIDEYKSIISSQEHRKIDKMHVLMYLNQPQNMSQHLNIKSNFDSIAERELSLEGKIKLNNIESLLEFQGMDRIEIHAKSIEFKSFLGFPDQISFQDQISLINIEQDEKVLSHEWNVLKSFNHTNNLSPLQVSQLLDIYNHNQSTKLNMIYKNSNIFDQEYLIKQISHGTSNDKNKRFKEFKSNKIKRENENDNNIKAGFLRFSQNQELKNQKNSIINKYVGK